LPTARITAEKVKDADILLTRTGVQVNAALLTNSSVRFAATATIGDDHYDKEWLDKQGVVWATAAGSSTISVVEYLLAALFELHQQKKCNLSEMTLGIVGVGRIGGLLAEVCQSLGIRVLLNDPPRQRAEADLAWVDLEQLLTEADVVTLHTPLIREGEDRTVHLFDEKHLRMFRGVGIINAARGSCVDHTALLDWLKKDESRWCVMDCWEHEPHISLELLDSPACVIATPHIAGHSLDGKAANTQYVYDALCAYLKIEPTWSMEQALPATLMEEGVCVIESWADWQQLASHLYPMMQDSAALKATAFEAQEARGKQFVALRRNYPVRRTWAKQSMPAAQLFEEKTGEKV